jgi:hypothetical protein
VLIDVLKAHGVPSWWFSNHNRFGLWDNPVADLGMRADHTKFYRTSVETGFATVSYRHLPPQPGLPHTDGVGVLLGHVRLLRQTRLPLRF